MTAETTIDPKGPTSASHTPKHSCCGGDAAVVPQNAHAAPTNAPVVVLRQQE
jgi:hypothetical protein